MTDSSEHLDEQAKWILTKLQVDSSTHLTVKHLPYVRVALKDVSSQWYNLGVHFRVDINKLDGIKRANRNNSERCLTEMLAEWLKNPRHSPPTWRKVVIAVASRVGGDNPREAQRIAQDYKNGLEPVPGEDVDERVLGERDFRAIVDALCRGVATQWLEIGLLLGIPYSMLELIRDSHDEVAVRVNEVVRVWLEGRYNVEWFGRPSWKKLIETIGARAGGNNCALAFELAREHPADQTDDSREPTATSIGPTVPIPHTQTAPWHHTSSTIVDTELEMRDHYEITTFLCDLEKPHIVKLGQVLGLNYVKLKNAMDSSTFLGDVVAMWLRKEDQVLQRAPPTWRNLAEGLQSIGQTGIASKIRKDKL